jgi:hypothetical protein
MEVADGTVVETNRNVIAMRSFNVALNLIACYCTANRASDGRQFATSAAAYLVTQQTAYDCTARCADSTTLTTCIDFIDGVNDAAIGANSRTCRDDMVSRTSMMGGRSSVIGAIASAWRWHRRTRHGLAIRRQSSLRILPRR